MNPYNSYDELYPKKILICEWMEKSVFSIMTHHFFSLLLSASNEPVNLNPRKVFTIRKYVG